MNITRSRKLKWVASISYDRRAQTGSSFYQIIDNMKFSTRITTYVYALMKPGIFGLKTKRKNLGFTTTYTFNVTQNFVKHTENKFLNY
jgi:hypothetical protein